MKHCIHNPPKCLKIFSEHEIAKILTYAKESYFTNFQIYNYCLTDKKKNEEIKINVYIDVPVEVLPLSEALFMGKPKLEVDEEDEELNDDQKDNIIDNGESKE